MFESEVPFETELEPGITLAGKIDALGVDAKQKVSLWENKFVSLGTDAANTYSLLPLNLQGLLYCFAHEKMYGKKTVEIFEQVKDRFDPDARMNPGKIVRAKKMNDRTLFRYKPDYAVPEMDTSFDWSSWAGAGTRARLGIYSSFT